MIHDYYSIKDSFSIKNPFKSDFRLFEWYLHRIARESINKTLRILQKARKGEVLRLLLKLEAAVDQKDISLDYNKLQGFVYSLIRESGYGGIHDKEGYKYFCYSNIFPYGDMQAGDIKNFIIASPNRKVIDAVAEHLSTWKDRPIHIGDCSFTLHHFDRLDRPFPSTPVKIASATPIIVRIPEFNYDLFNVPVAARRSRYIYWRPMISF